jgi:uncharacterized protein (DUF849 family)/RimJ/RimL family protein N-acetyltransferase
MSFDFQPTLKGALLNLRPLREQDFEALYAVASDPLIWEQHPTRDRYQRDVFSALFRESIESGGALLALDAKDGRVIGSSRFHGYDEARSEVEIGWSFLARSHWGGAYNREMKRLMLQHAFRFVDTVVFLIGPQNYRSQRAIEKLGGVRVDPRGASVVYEITRSTFADAVFLQVALNGDRIHPAAPRTPAAIATAARAAVDAGAHSVHVHAFDAAGHETLDGADCSSVLHAIRVLCPAIPISLTTSATIVPDPKERLRIVAAWEDMPDLVSANQGEPAIVELCELLLSRGVGLEAGLLTADDARAFVRSGLADRCRRVLIEPLDADPEVALQHAAEIEDIVVSAGITLQQVHHGYGIACWAVNRRALDRGHGVRTGFEDITVLPDGSPARDNAELVAAAARLFRHGLTSQAHATSIADANSVHQRFRHDSP